jgi:hypothetical protein
MTDHLGVTPTRLRYLAEAEGGTLPLLLTAAQAELKTAGWIELHGRIDGPEPMVWRPTAYGRAIAAIRVLEREDGRHIVAETGDGDVPRVLGEAWREAGPWLCRVNNGGWYATVNTKHEAREELRHMAATLLAAETPTTVQEGH